MMSDADKNSGRDNPKREASTQATASPPGRTDDSGLHDIKALAQDTRKRISRRVTSQHDIDPSLLSASHSGLRAVALPEPALVVALPEVPATMADVRATATARDAAAITPITARKRTGLWLGLGAAGLAAAAAIVVVASGGKSTPAAPATTAVAASGSAAGPSAPGAAPASPTRAETSAVTAAADPVAMAGSGSAMPAPPVEDKGPKPAPPGDAPKVAVGAAGATGAARVDAAKPGRGSSAEPTAPVATKPAAGKGDAKPGGKPEGAKPVGATGEKSIEDLLNDASGGPTKPKDPAAGGGGDAPVKPDKTGLDSKDIKAGMGAVAGKAQGCFDKHSVAGHVKVRATVAASGAVTKVDATGEFAGTPTGACVAGVVKGASFPAWTGAPMTVNYAFTLQE